MENFAIWQRANGRFAMVAFWAIVSAYTYATYIA
tara:strand:- start:34 stop:135 length:102 start_codon:yes stop_codon:yes gene_type:complete